MDIFEQNLAKQAQIDKHLDEVNAKLLSLQDRFHSTTTQLEQQQLNDDRECNRNCGYFDAAYEADLKRHHEKLMDECDQLDRLDNELNALVNEKAELLKEDCRNLNRSRVGSLQEGFNEVIFELDLKRANDIDCELADLKSELGSMKLKFGAQLSSIRGKLDELSLNKKQKKLDELSDTLNLQLDSLVSLQLLKEKEVEVVEVKGDEKEEEEEDDDLFRESANILLDQVALLDESCRSAHSEVEKPLVYSLQVAGNSSMPPCRVGFYSTRNSIENMLTTSATAAGAISPPHLRSRSLDAATAKSRLG